MNIQKPNFGSKINQSYQVKFYFTNQVGNKQCQLQINPFSPLINYKRHLQNTSKIDLYGKKLIFKYIDQLHGNSFNIQYLQQIVQRTKQQLKQHLDIEISYQQIGG